MYNAHVIARRIRLIKDAWWRSRGCYILTHRDDRALLGRTKSAEVCYSMPNFLELLCRFPLDQT